MTRPYEDSAPQRDQVLAEMPGWAECAAERGLQALFDDPEFARFWQGLSRDNTLLDAFLELLSALVEDNRTELPCQNADIAEVHERVVRRLSARAVDPGDHEGDAALAALCQFSVIGDGAAARGLEQVLENPHGRARLLRLTESRDHERQVVLRALARVKPTSRHGKQLTGLLQRIASDPADPDRDLAGQALKAR